MDIFWVQQGPKLRSNKKDMMPRFLAGCGGSLSAVVCALLFVWTSGTDMGMAAAVKEPAAMKEARAAFEQKRYERAMELLDRLSKESVLPVDGMRLKSRTFLKLGKPQEALREYDRLEQTFKLDDPALLTEVSLGFVVVLTKDMREQMRGASYTALKDFESAEVVPYLENGLSDGSGLVRALVVEGLGRTEQGRRSQKLRKALDDQAGLVRAAVLKVLGRSRDRSVLPLLEKALTEDQPVVRLAASGALYHMGRTDMWDRIRKAATVAHPEERATALRLLGELQDPRGLPVLVEAMKDPQPSVRGAAVSALGDLGESQAVSQLEEALQDTIPAVRTSAAISLGELGHKQVIPALRRALSDTNPVVQAAVVSALLRVGEPIGVVMPSVGELIQHNDPGVRSAIAKALGRAHSENREGAVAVLADILGDPIPRPRIAAARSLGQIGGQDLVPVLKRALHDEDDAVRATAGGALCRVYSAVGRAVPSLKYKEISSMDFRLTWVVPF
jgi:HEAT repeat protein